MEWSETGIVLSARPHGETSAIVDLFTRGHGRHLGLVRGGRSRRLRAALQIGNSASAIWRARLEDHLGAYIIEPETFRAAKIIDDPLKLNALSSLCALAGLLPERQPHQRLYDALLLVLDGLEDDNIWPALSVRWELGLLEALGFGLDLSSCAATGTTDDLIYVSPRSARAVSAKAGEPYKAGLFALPGFLRIVENRGIDTSGTGAGTSDILDGFALTGFFLVKHVFEPRGLELPQARARAIEQLKRHLSPKN